LESKKETSEQKGQNQKKFSKAGARFDDGREKEVCEKNKDDPKEAHNGSKNKRTRTKTYTDKG